MFSLHFSSFQPDVLGASPCFSICPGGQELGQIYQGEGLLLLDEPGGALAKTNDGVLGRFSPAPVFLWLWSQNHAKPPERFTPPKVPSGFMLSVLGRFPSVSWVFSVVFVEQFLRLLISSRRVARVGSFGASGCDDCQWLT